MPRQRKLKILCVKVPIEMYKKLEEMGSGVIEESRSKIVPVSTIVRVALLEYITRHAQDSQLRDK